MNLERWFFGSIVQPAYHLVKGDQVNVRTAQYERMQWRSDTEIAAMQADKLAELLRHAARHVPYYQQIIGSAQAPRFSLEDFGQVPPLTKSIIRQAAGKLRAENARDRDLEANSTSGSTGEPLYFYTDRRSADCRKASVVRNRRWAGIEPGDREVRLWGSPIDNKKADELRGRLHGCLTRSKMLSAYDLSRPTLHEYLRVMRSYRPKLLIAYPSVLMELAQEAQSVGAGFPDLRAIIVSAETLHPFQREFCTKTFGVPIFNRYGSREVGDIAQECDMHDGLHINSDRILVEVVRDDLSPCEPGEVGDVLVTDLENFGMPLIRYAIGDRAAFAVRGTCACGRRLPRLASIEGRSLDVIRFPNGSAVGGTYWTIILRKNPGIEQFQVVQVAATAIVIYYVGSQALPSEVVQFIRNEVMQRAGPKFEVVFERVAQIPVNAAGKRRFVVNELSAS